MRQVRRGREDQEGQVADTKSACAAYEGIVKGQSAGGQLGVGGGLGCLTPYSYFAPLKETVILRNGLHSNFEIRC